MDIEENKQNAHTENLLEKGLKSLDDNRFFDAIQYFDEAVESDEFHVKAQFYSGIARLKLNQPDKALKHFTKALKLNSEDSEFWLYQGMALEALGERDKSKDSFEKVIQLSPDNAQAYCKLGLFYSEKNQHDRAMEYFIMANKINPSDASVYINMGNSTDEAGDDEKAIEYYKTAIEIDPNDARAYFLMGLAYMDLENFAQARILFEKAIAIKADYASAYLQLGILLLNAECEIRNAECEIRNDENKTSETENFISAKSCIQSVLQLESANSEANYYMGLIFASEGQHEQAIDHFKAAIKANSLHEDAYLSMAKSFLKLDENNLALECLLKAHKMAQNSFEIAYNLAMAYFLQAEYEKSIRYFEHSSLIKPNNRDTYYYKGLACARLDDTAEAIKCFNLILSLTPDDHFAMYQLGLVNLQCGNREAGINLLKNAKKYGNEEADMLLT